MSAPGAEGRLELEAPAKVNLYLEVVGRRPDGFHELVTVMTTLALADGVGLALRERRAHVPRGTPDVQLTQTAEPPFRGELPDLGDRNLAWIAAATLLRSAGVVDDVGVEIQLVKRIPAGGGLGGGSSDAACVLQGLDQLLGAPCGATQLHELAATLGSDVPFFLTGGTALCLGRGERVTPIERSAEFDLTLMLPPFPVSTAAVYGALRAPQASRPVSAAAISELVTGFRDADESVLDALFRNDLQPAAVEVEPRLARMLDEDGMHLSGSGSTLFAFGRDVCGLPGTNRISSIACVRPRARRR